VIRLTLKEDKKVIENNFREEYATGELIGNETNSNYVELRYLMKYHNVKIIVDGEVYGLDRVGKLAKILPNIETIRTVCSKLRSELKLEKDIASQQEFKEVMGKNE
jgi:hypothetical protein